MGTAIFNKGVESEKQKQLTRLYTILKIYSPAFDEGMKYYFFEKTETMSNRNIDSDSDEETLVTQHLKVKLLQVNTKLKKLEEVYNPTVTEIKKMEQIIDNLYKRIPLYVEI